MAQAVQRQLALAGQELLINRGAKDGEPLAPLPDAGELLARHRARQEKILGILAQPLNHVFLGGIIVVAGGNRVTVHLERREELEHLLDLLHVGFLVNRRVGGHLETEHFGHANGLDTFLEDPFAFDD